MEGNIVYTYFEDSFTSVYTPVYKIRCNKFVGGVDFQTVIFLTPSVK